MRAVAAGGSVRAAADQLKLHHSTVIRRVEQLERELETLVFTRTPHGLELTSEGTAVLAHAEKIQKEVNQLELAVQGSDQKYAGIVRITMPDILAVGFLMEDFAQFSEQYPDIEVMFIPSHVTLDIASREADIAIRVTENPPGDLVGKKVANFSLGVYAHENYLKNHDPVHHPETCHWIGWGETGRDMQGLKEELYPKVPVKSRCDSVLLQLSAVKSGVGMALLPCGVADQETGLVRLSEQIYKAGSELWILTHPDLRYAARIKVLMKFLGECFSKRAALLLGDAQVPVAKLSSL